MAAAVLCKAFVQPKKGEPKPCPRKAKDKGYCGTHYASELLREREEQDKRTKKEDLERRISEYLKYREEHPSVWD